MERNQTIAAPQLDYISDAYDLWHKSNTGTLSDFLSFMERPSAERTRFLAQRPVNYLMYGNIFTQIFS